MTSDDHLHIPHGTAGTGGYRLSNPPPTAKSPKPTHQHQEPSLFVPTSPCTSFGDAETPMRSSQAQPSILPLAVIALCSESRLLPPQSRKPFDRFTPVSPNLAQITSTSLTYGSRKVPVQNYMLHQNQEIVQDIRYYYQYIEI